MSSEEPANVLVIGAGPTGLAAAWDLAAAGHPVSVIERAPFPGGMSASIDVGGQRVDFGSHRLHGRADPELLAVLRSLLGDDLQTRQRNGRIRLEGRWVGFPLRIGDLVRHLPRRFAAGAAVDALASPLRRPGGTDFASVVRAGLGSRVFTAFYEPYAKKLWGVDPSTIDGSMAERRVSAGSPIDIIKRLVVARNEEGRVFYYPRLGYGQITDAMAAAVESCGGTIHCQTAVESIDLTSERPVVRLTGPGGVDVVRPDTIISTIPAGHLVDLVVPKASPATIRAAGSLEQRAMVLVYLVVERPQYSEFDAHYFPGLDTIVARLSEPKNYRSGPDAADRTVLCAEIACSIGDPVWEADDAELGRRVARELVDQGLPSCNYVEVEVRRLPSVYPIYRHGYRADLDAVEAWAATHENMLVVGRQALFVPDNLHHTVAMGRAAASVISADGLIDRSAWSLARDRFRSHVVED